MKKWIAVILTLTLAAALFCAVPAAAAEKQTDEESQTAGDEAAPADGDAAEEDEELAELERLGEQTEDCGLMKLTNMTGSDIVAFSLKGTADFAWSESLLAEDDVFQAEQSRALCYPLPEQEDKDEAEEPEDTDEAKAPYTYDIQFQLADETVCVCHGLDLADMTDAQLMLAWNGVAYVVYTSAASGEEVDTSEAAQAAAIAGGGADDTPGDSCIGGSGLFY